MVLRKFFSIIFEGQSILLEKTYILICKSLFLVYASNNGENQQTPTNTDIDTIDRPLLCDQIRQLLLQDDKNLQQILPPRNTPPLGEIPSPLPNIPQHPKNPRQPPPSHPHAPSMSTETYYFKNIFFTNSNMIIEIDVPLMSCQKTIDLQDPEFYILNLPTNPNTYFILSSSSNKLCVTPKSKNLYFYAYVDTIPDETEENRHV